MDFIRYAERAAALVNNPLEELDDLRRHLDDRAWLQGSLETSDLPALREVKAELRPMFEASARHDVTTLVQLLNQGLARHPVTPMISDHDPDDLHMHIADRSRSVADLLTGEALMGLATLVCDLGPTRLGTCQAEKCTNVFVDTSPNASRRYCSDRCSSRANVAAYRARQKAATA